MSSKGNNRRATTPNDGQEPSPSKLRRGPPPEYYNCYSDSDSEAEFDAEKHQADLEVHTTAPEDHRERMVGLLSHVTLIVSPTATRNALLCALGSHVSGWPKDPRTVLEGPWDITPIDVPDLAEPAAFWQRDVKDAIRAQTSSTGPIALDIFIDGEPFKKLDNPKLMSWIVLGRVREATKPPGEPFGLSVFSGSEAPSAEVLLGPLCQQLQELPNVTARAFLGDAEACARAKETVHQNEFFGCQKCIIPGETVNEKVSFYRDTPFPARTHAEFVAHRYDDTHRTGGDPTQMTPLARLQIDIIKDVIVSDDRYLLHLGAVKNFWELFTHKSRMSANDYDKLQNLLCEVRFPHERKDGQFGRNIGLWTPSMWGYILDVVGFVVFQQVLSHQLFEFYCKLHWAVAICNGTRNRRLLRYAQLLFELYVKDYKKFVGSVPYNVHCLLHVVDEVRDKGPLPGQSTNPFEAELIGLKLKVNTVEPKRVVKTVATALLLREAARRHRLVLNIPYPTVTHEGRRVKIREKFLLRNETISASDANGWFLVKTNNIKGVEDVEVVKFEQALAPEQDFGSLVVLGRPLATAAMKAFIHPVTVPPALNVFFVKNKRELKKAQSYRVSDIVCKLCVVDLPIYTSFVPLIESFAELFELP